MLWHWNKWGFMAGESLVISQRRGSRHCGMILKLSVECLVVYLIDDYIFEHYHSFLFFVFFQAFEDLSKLMVKVSNAVLYMFTFSSLCWFNLDVKPVLSSSIDSASGLAEWFVLSLLTGQRDGGAIQIYSQQDQRQAGRHNRRRGTDCRQKQEENGLSFKSFYVKQ